MTAAPAPLGAQELLPRSGRLRRRLLTDRLARWLLLAPFVIVFFPLFDMIYWIGARALPTFTLATLTQDQVGTGGGLFAMIVGTLVVIGLATAIAAAIGIVAGLYTAEYAPPGIARIGRIAGNSLAGVPAVVLGYFGFFFLVRFADWGYSTLAGAITLAVMMVPFIYRTSDLAFTSVPANQREAALALGSRRHQFLARVAFPIALPTILTGIFLAMALGLGETAPLLFTAGWSSTPLTGLFSPTSFLTGAIWLFYQEPAGLGTLLTLAFQAALVLIAIVVALNIGLQWLAERYRRRLRGLLS
jgi:phosphate transport system permease protein